MGKGWCDVDPNKLVFTFADSYVCVNFGENRSRNATVREPTVGYTDTLTDANRFYNLSIIVIIIIIITIIIIFIKSCQKATYSAAENNVRV